MIVVLFRLPGDIAIGLNGFSGLQLELLLWSSHNDAGASYGGTEEEQNSWMKIIKNVSFFMLDTLKVACSSLIR